MSIIMHHIWLCGNKWKFIFSENEHSGDRGRVVSRENLISHGVQNAFCNALITMNYISLTFFSKSVTVNFEFLNFEFFS